MVLMYMRKSRSDSVEEDTLAVHYSILQNLAKKMFGEEIPEEQIYREIVSGETIQNRPKLQKMLSLIEQGNVEAVMVVDCSRLSRGSLSDAGRIIDTLYYTKTKVITPVKTFDLDEQFDKKAFEMELLHSKDYLEYIKTIFNRGRRNAMEKGRFMSKAPLGYKVEFISSSTGRRSHLVIDEENAPIIRMAFALALQGKNNGEIATALNEHGYRTVTGIEFQNNLIHYMLRNPVYCGLVRNGRRRIVKKMVDGKIITSRPQNKNEDCEFFEGDFEPIISRADFEAVQKRIRAVKSYTDRDISNPLASLAKCPYCGKTLVKSGTFKYSAGNLRCPNQSRVCRRRSTPIEMLMEKLTDTLKMDLSNFSIDFDMEVDNEEEELIKKEIAVIQKKIQRIYTFYENGDYDRETFNERMSIAKSDLDRLHGRLNTILNEKPDKEKAESTALTIYKVLEDMKREHLSPKEINDILKTFISAIYVYTEQTTDTKRSEEHEFTLKIEYI